MISVVRFKYDALLPGDQYVDTYDSFLVAPDEMLAWRQGAVAVRRGRQGGWERPEWKKNIKNRLKKIAPINILLSFLFSN